ncbi:MAG: hypothetical protein ABI867_33620 [Kofleriaceae bacterium]
MKAALGMIVLASYAEAKPWHGSVGAGGVLVLTGEHGDRQRAEVAIDLEFGSRFGVVAAWRAFDEDHDGLVTAGIVFEAAASRPRLVLALHGDAGIDLDARAPLIGGGLRTTLTIIGPLGVAFDTGAYLVLDGIDDTRLQLQSSGSIVARW